MLCPLSIVRLSIERVLSGLSELSSFYNSFYRSHSVVCLSAAALFLHSASGCGYENPCFQQYAHVCCTRPSWLSCSLLCCVHLPSWKSGQTGSLLNLAFWELPAWVFSLGNVVNMLTYVRLAKQLRGYYLCVP